MDKATGMAMERKNKKDKKEEDFYCEDVYYLLYEYLIDSTKI